MLSKSPFVAPTRRTVLEVASELHIVAMWPLVLCMPTHAAHFSGLVAGALHSPAIAPCAISQVEVLVVSQCVLTPLRTCLTARMC